MRKAIACAIAGAVLTVTGCSQPPPKGEYKLPLKEALSRLENADIIGFRNSRQCGLLIHFDTRGAINNSITWIVTSSSREVAKFTVALSPFENGVKSAIIMPKGDKGGEMYDGKQHYSHPAFMQPMRPALQELIDSAMEKRPYDWNLIPDPINIGPSDSMNNCGLGQQTLARGFPMDLDDPEGIPSHDYQVYAGWVK